MKKIKRNEYISIMDSQYDLHQQAAEESKDEQNDNINNINVRTFDKSTFSDNLIKKMTSPEKLSVLKDDGSILLSTDFMTYPVKRNWFYNFDSSRYTDTKYYEEIKYNALHKENDIIGTVDTYVSYEDFKNAHGNTISEKIATLCAKDKLNVDINLISEEQYRKLKDDASKSKNPRNYYKEAVKELGKKDKASKKIIDIFNNSLKPRHIPVKIEEVEKTVKDENGNEKKERQNIMTFRTPSLEGDVDVPLNLYYTQLLKMTGIEKTPNEFIVHPKFKFKVGLDKESNDLGLNLTIAGLIRVKPFLFAKEGFTIDLSFSLNLSVLKLFTKGFASLLDTQIEDNDKKIKAFSIHKGYDFDVRGTNYYARMTEELKGYISCQIEDCMEYIEKRANKRYPDLKKKFPELDVKVSDYHDYLNIKNATTQKEKDDLYKIDNASIKMDKISYLLNIKKSDIDTKRYEKENMPGHPFESNDGLIYEVPHKTYCKAINDYFAAIEMIDGLKEQKNLLEDMSMSELVDFATDNNMINNDFYYECIEIQKLIAEKESVKNQENGHEMQER